MVTTKRIGVIVFLGMVIAGVLAVVNSSSAGNTITICHATSSATNPYVQITISVNGLNGHSNHANDIIPAPLGGCPGAGGGPGPFPG